MIILMLVYFFFFFSICVRVRNRLEGLRPPIWRSETETVLDVSFLVALFFCFRLVIFERASCCLSTKALSSFEIMRRLK